MKNNTLFSAFVFSFSLVILVLLISPAAAQAKSYQPEISGSFESGDRLYSDSNSWENDEPLDYYSFDKQWLKYKQQLAVGEYYYLKIQRQQKIYDQSQNYNSLSLETEGNYTFYVKEKLRSRLKLLLRDKDYLEDEYNNKNYQLSRLQCSLQYEYSDFHDYELILQKQWTEYELSPQFDYQTDRIALNWGWQLSPDLQLDTKIQYDWQHNDQNSSRSDKEGRKISLKFKYKL